MTPQELQVLSDGLKIGLPILGTVLGAVVGGVTTFFLTRANHANETKKELGKRRHEILMQIAKDVSEFENVFAAYSHALTTVAVGSIVAVADTRKEVTTNNHMIRRARMNLRLLSLTEALTRLESYIELTREMWAGGLGMDKDRLKVISVLITRGPVDFYEALAEEIEIAKLS